MRLLFTTLLSLFTIVSVSQAAVTFSQQGNDLQIEFAETLNFNVISSSGSVGEIGILFEGIYPPSGLGYGSDPSASSTTTLTAPGNITSINYDNWTNFKNVSPTGIASQNDFYGSYFLPSSVSLTPGNTVTINPGVIILSSYFSLGWPMPSNPTTAVLWTGSFEQLSDVKAVPEPAMGACLLGLAALTFVGLGRRQAIGK